MLVKQHDPHCWNWMAACSECKWKKYLHFAISSQLIGIVLKGAQFNIQVIVVAIGPMFGDWR